MAEQLSLAAVTKPPDVRPDSLGPAAITYSDSKTLLTRASGFMDNYDFTLNPYSGCGFGCEYCYARFFAPTEEARDTWGQWVKVKENAVETIRNRQRPLLLTRSGANIELDDEATEDDADEAKDVPA